MRPICTMVDAALSELDADFNAIYSDSGRDSIPPEKLPSAQLLMAFYTLRSERQWMEQIDYNLLFRRFVGFSERACAPRRSWAVWMHCVAPTRHRMSPEHEQPFIGHRWTHHPPSGLCHQPTLSQADQGMLRLGRGHRRDTQEPPCGTKEAGLPVRTEPVRLQPGSPAQSGDGGMSMAGLQGFGVPGNRRIGPDWPISGQRAGVTVLHLLLAARKAPSVGLFSTACQTNAFKYAA